MTEPLLELVCPAGTPAALRAAIDAGADTVYAGFRDETNAGAGRVYVTAAWMPLMTFVIPVAVAFLLLVGAGIL